MVSNGDEAKSSLRFELAERKAVGWDTEEEVVRPHTVLVIVGTWNRLALWGIYLMTCLHYFDSDYPEH